MIKSKNSTDGINFNILNAAWEWVGPLILKVINLSLQTRVVPRLWKETTVIPIPKVVNACKANDFRPINMLPLLEKVLVVFSTEV